MLTSAPESTATARVISACRACGAGDLDEVLDLGAHCVSDFLDPGEPDPERVPLTLVRCTRCGLVQLTHTVDRDRLYRTYYYRSGVNETMVAALQDVVRDATSRVTLEPGDWVCDIGCNDGTLLDQYPTHVKKIGFDPSQVGREAVRGGSQRCVIVNDYFPTVYPVDPVPCKIVTAVAMFYDLDDPGAFLEEVKKWLHPEGVLVLQFQDLGSMVRANAVDNICHEHLTYWSIDTLRLLTDRYGLVITEWSEQPINGGSIRVVIRYEGHLPMWALPEHGWPRALQEFAERVRLLRGQTLDFLRYYRSHDYLIYGIAASTKFNTLAQWYGLTPDLIQAIGERSPTKVGKVTVGTRIPIVSEEAMRAARPAFLFTGAWQFADAFARREADLLAHGTRLIVPLPTLRTVGG